jgi:hypothetical protein
MVSKIDIFDASCDIHQIWQALSWGWAIPPNAEFTVLYLYAFTATKFVTCPVCGFHRAFIAKL